MTERLYYDDSYLKEFEATVTLTRPDGWIALDRSAFYPTSGGQPYDTGVLAWEGGEVQVTDVEAQEGTVWHRVSAPLAQGLRVKGSIHWPRRFDHMQQHAADHMLAGAAWQLHGAVTIGLHLGHENSTIDLTFPDGRTHLTLEEILALETLVNERVQQDDPIRCWFPAPEELAVLPLRKPPTVREHVRVVAMGDYEMVACGGTHPRSTGQIGPIKILSASPARGKMRLCFVAGMRSIRLFQQTAACAFQVSAALSSDLEGAADALTRERESLASIRKEMGRRLVLSSAALAAARKEGDLYACHLPFADGETTLKAALEIVKDPTATALLSCPRKEGVQLVFARGAQVQADMAALMRRCGGRGGGKPDLAQGSAPGEEALAEAKRLLLGGI